MLVNIQSVITSVQKGGKLDKTWSDMHPRNQGRCFGEREYFVTIPGNWRKYFII